MNISEESQREYERGLKAFHEAIIEAAYEHMNRVRRDLFDKFLTERDVHQDRVKAETERLEQSYRELRDHANDTLSRLLEAFAKEKR